MKRVSAEYCLLHTLNTARLYFFRLLAYAPFGASHPEACWLRRRGGGGGAMVGGGGGVVGARGRGRARGGGG
eukprot:scaffold2375_cov62-Phaeocystis_antarctica.AAC.2